MNKKITERAYNMIKRQEELYRVAGYSYLKWMQEIEKEMERLDWAEIPIDPLHKELLDHIGEQPLNEEMFSGFENVAKKLNELVNGSYPVDDLAFYVGELWRVVLGLRFVFDCGGHAWEFVADILAELEVPVHTQVLNVNIKVYQVPGEDMTELINRALQQHGAEPIELEITKGTL